MVILKARRIILISTALILSFMLVVFLYRTTQKPIELYAVQAMEKTINNHLSLQGTLKPEQDSDIAAAVPVRVVKTYVQTGDVVQFGDPLLCVEQIEWIEQDMFGAVSAFLEDTFTSNVQEGAVLYADMNGTVTFCAAAGDVLYPAQIAASLADFSVSRVLIEVPEIYADGLELGQTATAEPISGDTVVYTGVLTEIGANIIEKTNFLSAESERVVESALTLQKTDNQLRPGTTMDVTICTDTVKHAVTVPYTAVHQDNAGEYVYVVSEEGIERRSIETGYQLSSDIQIKKGLEVGEWVVIDETVPDDLPKGFVVMQA